MQQDQWQSCPPLDIVQANPSHLNESPDGRVTTLGLLCKPPVQKGGRGGRRDNTGRDRKDFRAILEEVRARDFASRKYTVDASGRCTTTRACPGMLHCRATAHGAIRSCRSDWRAGSIPKREEGHQPRAISRHLPSPVCFPAHAASSPHRYRAPTPGEGSRRSNCRPLFLAGPVRL
jgi:hypothetical protein